MNSGHTCEKCGSNIASVKVTRLSKGAVEETWLCSDCANVQSGYASKASTLSIEALLTGLLGAQIEAVGASGSSAGGTRVEEDLICATCGLPFASYRGQSILGCSDCYTSFEEPLLADLRKFHGCVSHQGRVPGSAPRHFQTIADAELLRERLARAVANEDFLLAAELKEKLRALEASTT